MSATRNERAQPLLLASSSQFRRDLLGRLQIPFDVIDPAVDERALPGERPPDTALRLARAKAEAGRQRAPRALIIGSDQVAELDGTPIGKPLTHANAVRQLRSARGRSVTFHTGLCLLNARSGHAQTALLPVTVSYRNYSDAQIEAYLQRERPYHCAGSARFEGLGIALIERIDGDDPTALIGLPLMALIGMLGNEGVEVV